MDGYNRSFKGAYQNLKRILFDLYVLVTLLMLAIALVGALAFIS